MRTLVLVLFGLAGAAWFFSISIRRTNRQISEHQQEVESVLLLAAILVFAALYAR